MEYPIDYWKGEFGRAYHTRNKVTDAGISSRWTFWDKIFRRLYVVPKTILEIGAGNGENLITIDRLVFSYRMSGPTTVFPELHAVEPNADAVLNLTANAPVKSVLEANITDLSALKNNSFELVFTYGVLIHVDPYDLDKAVDEMIRVSNKYVMCAEYFAPECEELEYRGMYSLLWRNNFGKFFLDRGLNLVDYGFMWKEATGLDNITYWIFKK